MAAGFGAKKVAVRILQAKIVARASFLFLR
jgi:hypothetical protein